MILRKRWIRITAQREYTIEAVVRATHRLRIARGSTSNAASGEWAAGRAILTGKITSFGTQQGGEE